MSPPRSGEPLDRSRPARLPGFTHRSSRACRCHRRERGPAPLLRCRRIDVDDGTIDALDSNSDDACDESAAGERLGGRLGLRLSTRAASRQRLPRARDRAGCRQTAGVRRLASIEGISRNLRGPPWRRVGARWRSMPFWACATEMGDPRRSGTESRRVGTASVNDPQARRQRYRSHRRRPPLLARCAGWRFAFGPGRS